MQALRHPWLKKTLSGRTLAPKKPLSGTVVQRLQRYGTYGRFKQKLLTAVQYRMKQIVNDKELDTLKQLFMEMDTSRHGRLSFNDLRVGLKKAGYRVSDSEVEQLMSTMDLDDDGGEIRYIVGCLFIVFSHYS